MSPNKVPSVDAEAAEQEFQRFYRNNREEVTRALVLAAGEYHLGCEAADEAFTRAFERWSDVRSYGNRQGWVYRVGLNWARSKMRRRKREVWGLFEEPSYVDELPEPELLAAVAALPSQYRSVLVARFFLDWSLEATAEALGVAEGTVKARQHRALRRIRRQMETVR